MHFRIMYLLLCVRMCHRINAFVISFVHIHNRCTHSVALCYTKFTDILLFQYNMSLHVLICEFCILMQFSKHKGLFCIHHTCDKFITSSRRYCYQARLLVAFVGWVIRSFVHYTHKVQV